MKFILFLFLFSSTSFANNDTVADVCREMKLIPASKAVVQWERIFSSDKRKKRYNIDQLSEEVQNKLKIYLIDHAADSSQPMVPGL